MVFTPSNSACGPWPLTTALTLLTKDMLLQTPSPLHSLFLLPAPLLLPYAYQLLRLVLILSLSCLYLAVHTKPKPSWPGPIDGSFTSLLGLRTDQKNRIFVCISLIIFNWNRQHSPLGAQERFIKHLYALIAFSVRLALILSWIQQRG